MGYGGVTGVIKNKLYVVTLCHSIGYTEGGSCEGDRTGPRLFRYNPATDRWVTLAPPFSPAHIFQLRRCSYGRGWGNRGKVLPNGRRLIISTDCCPSTILPPTGGRPGTPGTGPRWRGNGRPG